MKRNLLLLTAFLILASCAKEITDFQDKDAAPEIYPDYAGVTIPVNIAPLNFKAANGGRLEMVEVSSANGSQKIVCKDGKLIWDIDDWKSLMKENVGGTITYTAYISDSTGKCFRYKPFEQYISPDSIDSRPAMFFGSRWDCIRGASRISIANL